MNRLLLGSCCLTLLGCRAPDLAIALPAQSAAHAPERVAIAYRDLASDRVVCVHGDELMHAASTMKVPVMIELFRQADTGERSLDAEVVVKNEFASIVDGSAYSLTPEDDSDKELYERIGKKLPVRELMRRMIVRSSNLATNILIELANAQRIQKTIESLGTRRMRVLRGVEDIKAYRKGLSNSATANDLMALMTAIARARRVQGGVRRDGRDPQRAGVQHAHPGRAAGGHEGRAQDRLDHAHPPRRGDRVSGGRARLRAGRADQGLRRHAGGGAGDRRGV